MTSLPDEKVNISNSISHTTQRFTTMPSRVYAQNHQGKLHPPHPRPTVSLDPRPVVIPILTSVIGFPILVFAIICLLRHRAIRLRREDHLKKLQSGARSVTLDLPARDRISYFSGASSPEISIRETGDKLESTVPSSSVLKSSLHNAGVRRSTSLRNNNHVKFVTPATTLDVSHTLQVDVVLHSIERLNGSPWKDGNSSQEIIEAGVEVHAQDKDSTR